VRVVDLSHPVSIHSPGWVGYPGLRLWYLQTHHTHGIVSQMVEMPLHLSTHMDAPMHGISGGGDMASIPLEQLVGPAAIADVSEVGEWGVYTPELVMRQVEVRPGDILILHTGWHRYYAGMPEEDLPRYFTRHPGPDRAFAAWAVQMRFRWIGVDCGSADHPMNTSIRYRFPALVREYERRFGVSVEERFPEADLFCMHHEPFRHGVIHAENLGGELATLLNRRCTVGAFPWKFVGGEASVCRIVAFLDEEAGEPAPARRGGEAG
jgi:kynurenine formamidase